MDAECNPADGATVLHEAGDGRYPCSGMCQFVLECVSLFWNVSVCFGMCQFAALCSDPVFR